MFTITLSLWELAKVNLITFNYYPGEGFGTKTGCLVPKCPPGD